MSFMLVTVAFLSFSMAQTDQSGAGPSGSGATLSSENRDGPESASNSEGVDANGERRICRRIPASRTHMYRRVCLTARQWRDYEDNNG